MEFDRVLIVEPRVLKEPAPVRKKKRDYDPAAEARLLYVAMTRARDDLYVLDAPNSWLIRKDKRDRPLVLGRPKRLGPYGIELIGSDVSHEQPPGTEGFQHDAEDLRRHLLTDVAAGTEAELVLLHGIPVASDQSPPYAVVAGGRQVAVVSERFRTDLYRMLCRSAHSVIDRWPPLITGLRIDCVESVAGSPAATEAAGLGAHGAWVAPRLCGLGRFHWYADETEGDE